MMLWTLPNLLTISRMGVIPFFVILFYLPHHILAQDKANLYATILFSFAASTDWLDGYFARKFNQTSEFGKFLDPVVDKLMVSTALIVLVDYGRIHASIAIIIIGREIAISALREWMAELGKHHSMAVITTGKIKTTLQMLAIIFLLYANSINIFGVNIDILSLGELLIIIATLLTIISMAFYAKIAYRQIRRG